MHTARADVDKLLPSTDILITTPFHPVRPLTFLSQLCHSFLKEVAHACRWHVVTCTSKGTALMQTLMHGSNLLCWSRASMSASTTWLAYLRLGRQA